ncbi:MAG: hypothetical protein ACO3UW_10775, partial [Candidatus Nanopelagicales bacterium]
MAWTRNQRGRRVYVTGTSETYALTYGCRIDAMRWADEDEARRFVEAFADGVPHTYVELVEVEATAWGWSG